MSTLQHGVQPSRQRLPPDCLALVIDCVDHPATLHSLLTVSKCVFAVSVKRLYKSTSIVNQRHRKTVLSFVRLVLSLTPCQDSVIRALRDEFEVYFPRGTVYTDYLALIRDVAYHPDDDAGYWRTDRFPRRNSSVYRGMDLRPWVSWAICEHSGLASITGLTIDCDHLAWYEVYIPRFASLQRIIFDVGSSEQVAQVHVFVQRYIHIHGPRARRISLELVGAYKDDFTTVLNIYAELESPCPHPRAITNSTFASYVLHQDTTDFTNVRTIEGFVDDLGRTRAILPRCPRLQSLDAMLSIHGSSLLDWLRPNCTGHQPVRSLSMPTTSTSALALPHSSSSSSFSFSFSSSSSSSPSSPSCLSPSSSLSPHYSPSPPFAPPVKHIQLHGSPSSVFKTLCDAATCFGLTLETIQLRDPDDTNEQPQVYRLAAGLCLPRLRELRIVFELNEYSVSFEPSSIPKMPALEILEMYHAFDRYTDIGGLQYSEEYHQIYPRTTWDVIQHMPVLRILHLSGRTASEFHPESLRHMPCLESLTARIRTSDWSRYWPRPLWTWDWELPFLRELHLGGVMASSFVFRALRHMPALERLRLECKSPTPMIIPDYETLLAMDISSDDNDWSSATMETAASRATAFGSTTSPPTPTRGRGVAGSIRGRPFGRNVKHILFGGRPRFTPRDWEQLLEHWFPNLEVLDLNFLITHRTRTIFEKARKHRCLRFLSLNTSDDELDDEDDGVDGELGHDSVDNDGDLIDEDWEPLHDSEDEGVERRAAAQAGQDNFFVCRIDEVLYRVKKRRDSC